MKRSVLFVLAAFFLFAGCRKEDQKPENHLLGTWQKTKLESKTATTNWKEMSQPCQLDDLEEYRPNGDWTLFDGANQCSASTGIMRGTWRQEASNTKIVYTYDGYGGEYESTVEELSENKMVLVQSTGQLNGQQIRYTYQKK